MSKVRLPESKIRALHIGQRPVVDAKGQTTLEPNTSGKPYRFKDGTQGAPKGFGVYVGKSGAIYEVVKRMGDTVQRVAIGPVENMRLADAHDEARKHLGTMAKGIKPAESKRKEEATDDAKHITVRTCMERYIERLDIRRAGGKVKPISVDAVRKSLARLERPEVNLADKEVDELTETMLITAWNALRLSAMKKSNRLSPAMKTALATRDEWWDLSVSEYQKMGITGKHIQRAMSAGLVAVEHTFADMNRAIEQAIRKERENARRAGRDVQLSVNPLDALHELDKWRKGKELKEHYRKAKVRNPLTKDETLPNVLKTLVARRNSMNALNSVGVDYILLTLLWGARRNEPTKLVWYDRVDQDTLLQEKASWVWLAPEPNAKNPTTQAKGSQVFFHDTKNGEVRHIPLGYFAERILRRRHDDHMAIDEQLPIELAEAEKALRVVKKETKDYRKVAKAEHTVRMTKDKMERRRWVFPAKSSKSEHGHYSDSKSLLANVRVDAGLVDLREDVDIGLTPHDLKRTFGRFAAEHLSGRLVSQLLNHKPEERDDQMSNVSLRYTEQEWSVLRDGLNVVEEAMIATSPRVWNALKGPDKQRLDEANDAPIEIKSGLRTKKTQAEEASA